jgi:hypothetical protein
VKTWQRGYCSRFIVQESVRHAPRAAAACRNGLCRIPDWNNGISKLTMRHNKHGLYCGMFVVSFEFLSTTFQKIDAPQSSCAGPSHRIFVVIKIQDDEQCTESRGGFVGTHRLRRHGRMPLVSCSAYSSIMKMEATCSSETLLDFQWTAWRNIPEGITLSKFDVCLCYMPSFLCSEPLLRETVDFYLE